MKKKTYLFLPIILLFCLLCAAPVSAKTMETMKGVTWDLVPGKTVTYQSYVGGAGFIKQKMRLSSPVTKLSSKSGYATLTYIMRFYRQQKLTAKQIHKICDYYEAHPTLTFDPRCYVAVVDSTTGKSLMVSNSHNVTVKLGSWKYGNVKTYTAGSDTVGIKNCVVKVTIEYPISYTGMCIGAGGWSRLTATNGDSNFWKGSVPFWKATGKYSTKKPKVAHFIRYKY